MENFFKDFKLTFLLTVVICLLALIPVIGPILIVGGISIFFIYAVLNSVFEDRETPKVKKDQNLYLILTNPTDLLIMNHLLLKLMKIYKLKIL